MSWAHELLGIGDDADERAIKRAYAARLRTTRPDEDPEGFQRLNEAYQTALAMLRHRLAQEQFAAEENTTDSGQEAPVESAVMDGTAAHASRDDADRGSHGENSPETFDDKAADVADAAPQGEAVTLDQFLDECLGAAGDGDPRVLEHWLRSQPVLWSLEHKAMIGHWLLRLMDARQPPMTERNFDILAEFFGYNDLHAGYDPLALQRLRARLIEAWRELQAQRRWQRPSGEPVPTSAYSFTSTAQSHQTSAPVPQQWTHDDEQLEQTRREQAWRHRLMRQFAHLVEKSSRLRDLRLLINPDHAVQLSAFLHDNPYGDLDDLPADIRRDEVAFWLSVADDRHWHRRRLLVALLRCALLTLPIFPIALLVQISEAPENGMQLSMAFESAFYPFAGLMLAWLGIASLKSLLYWQGDPPPDTRGWRMTHRCAIPALVQCSVVGMMIDHSSPLVFVVGMLALWAAVFRFVAMRRRATKRPPPTLTHRVIAALFLTMLSSLLVYLDSDKGGGLILLSWLAAIVLWIATLGDRSATQP